MKPMVDIIVPTYNRTDLLPETLKSVRDQGFSNWRCWIAEDGETKETLDAITPFLKDPRFIYVPGEHAGFPAAPRNRAILQGKAPYIAVLDDDDLWLPQKLERQMAFMESHPGCVLLGTNAFVWDGVKPWNISPRYFKSEVLGKIHYRALFRQNYIILSSALVRRAALEQSGLFNERLNPPISEDYELWLRIGVLGEIWVLPEPYTVFRQTPLTYYSNPDRRQKYQIAAGIFESVLRGVDNTPSPLSCPEHKQLAAACRRERDFYRAGPRFLGRWRHETAAKIQQCVSSYKMKNNE